MIHRNYAHNPACFSTLHMHCWLQTTVPIAFCSGTLHLYTFDGPAPGPVSNTFWAMMQTLTFCALAMEEVGIRLFCMWVCTEC